MEEKHITWIKDGYGGINRGPQEFEGIQNSNPIGETCNIIIQRYGTFVVQLKVTKGCLRSHAKTFGHSVSDTRHDGCHDSFLDETAFSGSNQASILRVLASE